MYMTIIYRTKCPTLAGLNKEEEIIKAYQDGLPMLQLEKLYNTHRQALKRILTRNGIELKTRKEIRNSKHYTDNFKQRKYKICDLKTQEDIIKMYLDYDSPEIIAKKYNVTPKAIRSHLKKHGISLRTSSESAQHEKTKKRKEQTCMDRFGVRNPLQDADIHAKMLESAHRYKTHTIQGVVFDNVQGYEPYALDHLVYEMNMDPSNIIAGRIGKVPVIHYSLDGTNRVYFPDIYVEQQNLLIEVKSEYTFNMSREKNLKKQEAAKGAGYEHKIFIFENTGKLVSII